MFFLNEIFQTTRSWNVSRLPFNAGRLNQQ